MVNEMEGRIRKGEEAEVLKPGRSEAKIAEVLRGVPFPPPASCSCQGRR